ncbi:MAG: hypothetical protein QOG43_2734 [Actinomycetota bacterium]|jgi:hypothetical protein|nr:hypothetical protein [Actinomycetota bacterium]
MGRTGRSGARRSLIAIGFVVGLALTSLVPAPARSAIPFVDRPVERLRPQDVVQVAAVIRTPPCRPGDLAVELFQRNGTTGRSTHSLRFTNVGEQPCSLSGRPRVTATLHGEALAANEFGRTYGGDPHPARDLQRGESAVLVVETNHLCDEASIPGAAHPLSDEVVFHLDRGDLRLPLQIGVTCGFAVSTFGSPLPPGVFWAETHRLAARIESLPRKAHPGEEIRFVAVVRNPTPGAVRLEPCPGYTVEFEGPGGVEIANVEFALNCDTVQMIEVGQTVRYEVRVTIPSEASGATTLLWTLIGDGAPARGDLLVVHLAG